MPMLCQCRPILDSHSRPQTVQVEFAVWVGGGRSCFLFARFVWKSTVLLLSRRYRLYSCIVAAVWLQTVLLSAVDLSTTWSTSPAWNLAGGYPWIDFSFFHYMHFRWQVLRGLLSGSGHCTWKDVTLWDSVWVAWRHHCMLVQRIVTDGGRTQWPVGWVTDFDGYLY
jgi:hypothetical protein